MPSLYEPTPETGKVSSANSTSLYSNTTAFTTGIVNSAVNSVSGGTGVTVDPTTGNVVVSIGQNVATSANVTFANIHATGDLSNNYFTLANSVGTNGQVLTTNGAGTTIWSTVGSLGVVTSITGTANQVIASSPTGAVTLSLPQSIGTGNSPTFAGATLGNVAVAITDDNTINTTTGDLKLDAATNLVIVSGNGYVSGYLDVDGDITTTNIQGAIAGTGSGTGLNLYSNNAEHALHLYDDYVQIVSGTTPGADWVFNSDGSTNFPYYKFPSADGTANQVLTTDGAGNVYWALPGGGGSTFGNVTIGVATDNTISTTTGNLDLTAAGTANYVTITSGTTSPTTITRNSTTTNTNIRSLLLNSQTSGTPVVGIGNSIEFDVETAVSVTKAGGYISVTSTDITPGAEDFKMSIGLMNNGAVYSEVARFESTGNLFLDGQINAPGGTLGNVTIGIDTDQTIGTTSGDLVLASATNVLNASTLGADFEFVTVDQQASLDSTTLTTTSTATVALNTTARNAMSGLVNIIQGSNVHCVNYTALRVNATTALLTTFGEMYNTSSLASFTADVSGGDLRLLITPSSATSTVFSAVRTALT